MTDPVTAVRAWAEYDEWAVFVWFADAKWGFSYHPKGAGDGPARHWGMESLEAAVFCVGAPLRSLRVLFSTGHEVEMQSTWSLRGVDMGREVYLLPRLANVDPLGLPAPIAKFRCDSDAEAVQRAIDAAVEWIGAQEGGEE